MALYAPLLRNNIYSIAFFLVFQMGCVCHPQKHLFRGKVCVIVIIRIWSMKIPIFYVSAFFHGGHIENGRFHPFLHQNATGNTSHLKEQKKCYRISVVSEDRGGGGGGGWGGAYRATIHPRLINVYIDPLDPEWCGANLNGIDFKLII